MVVWGSVGVRVVDGYARPVNVNLYFDEGAVFKPECNGV